MAGPSFSFLQIFIQTNTLTFSRLESLSFFYFFVPGLFTFYKCLLLFNERQVLALNYQILRDHFKIQ